MTKPETMFEILNPERRMVDRRSESRGDDRRFIPNHNIESKILLIMDSWLDVDTKINAVMELEGLK